MRELARLREIWRSEAGEFTVNALSFLSYLVLPPPRPKENDPPPNPTRRYNQHPLSPHLYYKNIKHTVLGHKKKGDRSTPKERKKKREEA
jgi:hypothetical protein